MTSSSSTWSIKWRWKPCLGSNFISFIMFHCFLRIMLSQIRRKLLKRNKPRWAEVGQEDTGYPRFIFIGRIKLADSAVGAVVKTHRLCGATQRNVLPPCLVLLTTWTEPELCIIDSAGPSLQLAKTRERKVRVWVEGTLISMETDSWEIVRGRPGEGELNGIFQRGRTTKGTGPKTWSALKERTGIILLLDSKHEVIEKNWDKWEEKRYERLAGAENPGLGFPGTQNKGCIIQQTERQTDRQTDG